MSRPDHQPVPAHTQPQSPATGPRPGTDDAVRATIGVLVTYAGALLVAGLVALLSDPGADGFRPAGATRAQLAVQGILFAAAALLLIEGLRLALRPRGAAADPLAAPRATGGFAGGAPLLTILVVGLGAALAAQLAGPLVSAVLPGLTDGDPPVDGLGIDTGLGSDLATVLVLVGLVPFGEELLFRGVLAGAWARAGRPVVAVLISSVFFSLAHITVGPRSMAVTALLGLLFAGAFLVSRSLAAPVLAHTLVNAVALLDAGLNDAAPLALLVVTVVMTTFVAMRLSPLVSWRAPGGTLTE